MLTGSSSAASAASSALDAGFAAAQAADSVLDDDDDEDSSGGRLATANAHSGMLSNTDRADNLPSRAALVSATSSWEDFEGVYFYTLPCAEMPRV